MTEAEGRRFWSHVRPEPGIGTCWNWTATNNHGYGYFYVRVSGRRVHLRAHRVAYEQHVGPIPEGLVLDHLCRNRACVNPSHLEAVTSKENVRRGLWKTHCVHGHALVSENLYVTPQGNRECRLCHRLKHRRRRARARGEQI